MFKSLWASAAILCLSSAVRAGDITGASTYYGPTQGVAFGLFSNIGVGLPTGQTCHGSPVVVLLTSNPRYTEIVSVLLTAEASHVSVKMYSLGTVMTNFGGTNYCTITEAGLGNFPLW